MGHVGILRDIFQQENIEEAQQDKILGLIDKDEMEQVFIFLESLNFSDKCSEILQNLFDLKGKDLSNIVDRASVLISGYENSMKSLDNLKKIIKFCKFYGISEYLNLDLGFARGLEYYTGMIFEIFIPDISIAVGGGGRYDHLIQTFGGIATPAVGCALGVDRVLLAMEQTKLFSEVALEPDKTLIIPINEEMLAISIELAEKFREKGICIEIEIIRKNLKKAFDYANSQNFRYVVIVGPEELAEDKFSLRDMKSGDQKTVTFDEALEILGNTRF